MNAAYIPLANYQHFCQLYSALNDKNNSTSYTEQYTLRELIKKSYYNRDPDCYITSVFKNIWNYVESFNKKITISSKKRDHMTDDIWGVWTVYEEIAKRNAPLLFPVGGCYLPNNDFFVHPGTKRLMLANLYKDLKLDVFILDHRIKEKSSFKDMKKYFDRDLYYENSPYQFEVKIYNYTHSSGLIKQRLSKFPNLLNYELFSRIHLLKRWSTRDYTLNLEIKNNTMYVNGISFIKKINNYYDFDI